MKTMLAIVFLAGLSTQAQTNRPVIVTNWITAAPNFREVNGQLYNIDRSQKWEDFNRCEVIHVSGNLILLDSTGYGQKKSFLLKNYPKEKFPAAGQIISVRALFVGTQEYPEFRNTYELYDYGTPHRIMVVVTNPITSTENFKTHRVSAGETLATIARQYHVSVKALEAENNMTDTRIKVGQILKIP
jgi:hypothetical protein